MIALEAGLCVLEICFASCAARLVFNGAAGVLVNDASCIIGDAKKSQDPS